jgi:pyridoxamine 5'-phosphate oxidase
VSHELPTPLPHDPLPLVERWLAEANERVRNATAMALATVAPDGTPTARMVICRGFDVRAGWFVFYTDRDSDKGADLAARPRAALVFHWTELERQIRVEGPVSLVPDTDSDRYWRTRPHDARIAGTTSRQSRPLTSRRELLERYAYNTETLREREVPRPDRWGGYRVWAESLELWLGQPARMHDRARWTRELARLEDDGLRGGPWQATRLEP